MRKRKDNKILNGDPDMFASDRVNSGLYHRAFHPEADGGRQWKEENEEKKRENQHHLEQNIFEYIKDSKDIDLFLLAFFYLNIEQHSHHNCISKVVTRECIVNCDQKKRTNKRLPVFESFAPS